MSVPPDLVHGLRQWVLKEDYEPVTVEEAATMVRLMTELRAAARALLPPAAIEKPAQ